MPSRTLVAIFAALVSLFALPDSNTLAQSAIRLESPAFAPGGLIPRVYTCADADRSPPLKWSGVPPGARSLALIVDDPDAPSGDWVHWVIYNISPHQNGLPEGVARSASLADGSLQGVNSFGKVGYNGPCPPSGSPHHYHFRLLAIDADLELQSRITASEVEDKSKGHVVASTELEGIFGR